MILFRSVSIKYLDKLGRKIEKTIPFNSDARRKVGDLYRDGNVIVLSVEGCDPSYEE